MRRILHPDVSQRLIKALLILLTALTLSILIFIITYLLLKGLPVFGLTFFTGHAIDMGRGRRDPPLHRRAPSSSRSWRWPSPRRSAWARRST